jgi:hypothetical protein
VVFSERNPSEPILEMVRVDWSPPVFTIPKEDAQKGYEKFASDVEEYKTYLTPFAQKVVRLYEEFLKTGKGFVLEDPEGVKNLTTYLVTESELIIENKKSGEKIVSGNYYGLWIGYNPQGEATKLFIGDFPKSLKPTKGDIEKALKLLEERKNRFLPKYGKRVDLPLL